MILHIGNELILRNTSCFFIHIHAAPNYLDSLQDPSGFLLNMCKVLVHIRTRQSGEVIPDDRVSRSRKVARAWWKKSFACRVLEKRQKIPLGTNFLITIIMKNNYVASWRLLTCYGQRHKFICKKMIARRYTIMFC